MVRCALSYSKYISLLFVYIMEHSYGNKYVFVCVEEGVDVRLTHILNGNAV